MKIIITRFLIFVSLLFFITGIIGCMNHSFGDPYSLDNFSNAKYVPPKDKVLLVIGCVVPSISNYVNEVGPVPAGFMTYTSVHGTEGLTTSFYAYGDPDAEQYAQSIIDNSAWDNTIVQMGLWMNDTNDPECKGVLPGITEGNYNSQIDTIGNWIKSANRPVYLRIGYEFDGTHNAYDPTEYKNAYKYIADRMRSNSVNNVAFVWHSWAAETHGGYSLSSWYPGDDYVDWIGISIFSQYINACGTVAHIETVCDFADTHKKPIMIAESAPYGGFVLQSWNGWFQPTFDYIQSRNIKMFSYVNTDWDAQTQWAGQGWGDSRVQSDPDILAAWKTEIAKDKYLQKEDNFINSLINY